MYYSNGSRKMGDYFSNNAIGKHVVLLANGTVEFKHY